MTKAEKLVQQIEKAIDTGIEIEFATDYDNFEILSVYPSDSNPNKLWFDIRRKEKQ